MDGYEATKQIRELKDPKKAKTVILALTANVWESSIQKCFEFGMNDVMPKPVSIEKLAQTIKKHLQF